MAERRKFLLDEIVGQRTPLGLAIPNYFDCGITDTPREKLMTQYGRPDPTSSWYADGDDFSRYAAGDWTITSTGGPTHALVAGAGGILSVTNSNGAADIDSFQRVAAAFYLVAGKQAVFRTRLNVSNLDMGWFAGLQVVNTDPSGASDGIYFYALGNAAGAVHLKAIATAASNTISGTLITTVASVFHIYTWYYDGSSRLLCSVDDGPPVSVAIANVPGPTIPLALTYGVKNTTGNARILLIDNVFGAVQR